MNIQSIPQLQHPELFRINSMNSSYSITYEEHVKQQIHIWGHRSTVTKLPFQELENLNPDGKAEDLSTAYPRLPHLNPEKDKPLTTPRSACFGSLTLHHSILSTEFRIDAERVIYPSHKQNHKKIFIHLQNER